MSWTDRYEYAGYALHVEQKTDAEVLALDAAVRFTAYNSVPMASGVPEGAEENDGEWWYEALECGAIAFENAVTNAILWGDGE